MYLDHANLLLARQAASSSTSCTGVGGGGIAGIVIGTFFGTLLLVYFISTVRGDNRPANVGYVVEDHRRSKPASTRRRGSTSSSHGSRPRSSRGAVREVREVRRPSRVYSTSS